MKKVGLLIAILAGAVVVIRRLPDDQREALARLSVDRMERMAARMPVG